MGVGMSEVSVCWSRWVCVCMCVVVMVVVGGWVWVCGGGDGGLVGPREERSEAVQVVQMAHGCRCGCAVQAGK
jgi:hypothetical protein